MMRGMYAAISGLEAHQTMLDVTANNLANVDTIGYKAQRTTFVDELSQLISPASGSNTSNGGTNPVQVGLGAQVGSIDNLMGSGSMETTGNPTDIAINGDGFLRVASGSPGSLSTNTEYTRAGNLTITPYTTTTGGVTSTTGYLTTQAGQYVLGWSAAGTSGTDAAIAIPSGATNVAIGQNGAVTYTDSNGNTQTAGYVTLATFPNEAGLQREGGSMWGQSANSGPATVATPGESGTGTTISGELEMSNVDMATEFTNMIEAERGYQANSTVISTADQMLQTIVQMPNA